VAPAAVRLFQAEGLEVHDVHPGFESKRNDGDIDIDLVVVECKSKLTREQKRRTEVRPTRRGLNGYK